MPYDEKLNIKQEIKMQCNAAHEISKVDTLDCRYHCDLFYIYLNITVTAENANGNEHIFPIFPIPSSKNFKGKSLSSTVI